MKGSFANITCAAAVAASSFDMIVTDPASLLDKIDQKRYNSMRAYPTSIGGLSLPTFVEPKPLLDDTTPTTEALKLFQSGGSLPETISGRVQRFGDNVDTDMVPKLA